MRPLPSAVLVMLALALAAGLVATRFLTRPPLPAPAVVHLASDTIPGTNWTAEDWRVLEAKVRWGLKARLDTLSLGDAIARLGETFVGATYTPGTLELPGPERLVVNLREFDCVTFIENVLALVRFVREDGASMLADPPQARRRYESYLRSLRYRGGELNRYPSRLHYFSEWLADNERRGTLRQISRDLGGVLDREPVSFMSTHPGSYRQLRDSSTLGSIRAAEDRINRSEGRWFIPEDRIGEVASRIRDGDIIAATSAIAGLDVAHTGLALWRNGRLHLLHAPLVGKNVEISAVPLADRILAIKGQDGVMVARVVFDPLRLPPRERREWPAHGTPHTPRGSSSSSGPG